MKRYTKKQWLTILRNYELLIKGLMSDEEFNEKYRKLRKRDVNKGILRNIRTKYKLYNLEMTELSLQKSKPKKKRKSRDAYYPREGLIDLINYLKEMLDENGIKYDSKKLIKVRLSNTTKINLLRIKKSTFYAYLKKTMKNTKLVQHADIIIEAFRDTHAIYGRVKLAEYIENKYKISINYRTLGRKMNLLGLKCKVRKAKKVSEIKVSNKCRNIVKRDYKGIKNNIIATDVSYIPAPKDIINKQNHVFLSIAIHHKTKLILDWKLSENNNIDLVISNFRDIPYMKNCIWHSDHGSQYFSDKYIELMKQKGAIQSASRIGNSLDNREAEYFFSIIKSELIHHLNLKNMTYDDLKYAINRYIVWYNNERLQHNLKEKTPQKAWDVFKKENSLIFLS